MKLQERRRCLKKYLTKLKGVRFSDELEIAADKDEHTAGGARGLAINGGDLMLALLEGQAGELCNDVLGALDLLPLESQHGSVLVKVRKPGPIRIEGRVVVLHECLGQRVWIHFGLGFLSLFSLSYNNGQNCSLYYLFLREERSSIFVGSVFIVSLSPFLLLAEITR